MSQEKISDSDKQKLYEALVDAVQRSKNFSAIPLPAILDNQLEQLNEKFGYNKDNIPEDARPKFDDEKVQEVKETKEQIKKKLKNKLKNLQKRRNKEQKSNKTLNI